MDLGILTQKPLAILVELLVIGPFLAGSEATLELELLDSNSIIPSPIFIVDLDMQG